MESNTNTAIKTTIKKNTSDGEYVVKLWIDGVHQPKANYFTDDKEDARETAKDMVARATYLRSVAPTITNVNLPARKLTSAEIVAKAQNKAMERRAQRTAREQQMDADQAHMDALIKAGKLSEASDYAAKRLRD